MILFILFSIPWGVNAQPVDTTLMRVRKTTDFSLTGKGDADNWKQTEYMEIPKLEGKAGYKTRMKILYSDSGIYCLYECEDEKLSSTIREDFADIYNEDVVEAFFWPDEQSVIYFEYELSPYNYELPILVPNYKGNFLGWRPWHYEGKRKTRHAVWINRKKGKVQGWTAEFFIPFVLLSPLQNVPPKKGMKWRANFYRIDYDQGASEWAWKPIRNNFHDYDRFGTIVFD